MLTPKAILCPPGWWADLQHVCISDIPARLLNASSLHWENDIGDYIIPHRTRSERSQSFPLSQPHPRPLLRAVRQKCISLSQLSTQSETPCPVRAVPRQVSKSISPRVKSRWVKRATVYFTKRHQKLGCHPEPHQNPYYMFSTYLHSIKYPCDAA